MTAAIIRRSIRRAAYRKPIPRPPHSFEDAVEGCRLSIEEAAAITGLDPADIVKAAE